MDVSNVKKSKVSVGIQVVILPPTSNSLRRERERERQRERERRQFITSTNHTRAPATYNVSHSVDFRSCIKDEQLLGVLVSLEYGVDVGLVLPASLWRGTQQRLATPSDGRVCDWVKPRENLCVFVCVCECEGYV